MGLVSSWYKLKKFPKPGTAGRLKAEIDRNELEFKANMDARSAEELQYTGPRVT